MRRKGMAVVGLTAALTIGAACSAWAAAGWVQNNGQWQYQDNYGYIVKNEWKTGADGKWRYLNSSGYIATDTWVDSEYYVDSSGIMVSDSWLQVNDPGSDNGVIWYYFGSNGKMITDGWKKINDKYYFFDGDGVMQTGWVDDNNYYTVSSGEMVTGWQQLEPPEDEDYTQEDDDNDPFTLIESDGRYWYYFKSSGKKVTPKDDGAENGVVRIDGDYYCMNMDGAIMYGWRNVSGGSSITDYKYFLSSGKMVTGWYSAEPPRSLEEADGEVHWYYFNSKGVPKADEDGIPTTKDLLSIGGKTYLFNEWGNPVYGLRKVYTGTDEDEFTSYYFGANENECWAHTGKQQVEEESGETNTFYFNASGRGYTGLNNGYLYYLGKIQTAQDDKYELINVPGKDYAVLVNTSGKVMKSSTVKMTDGTKYKTNSSGQVTQIDGENVSNLTGRDPDEPEWTTDDGYTVW